MKKITRKNISDIFFYVAIIIELMIVILDKSAYIIQYESYWFRLTFVLFLFKAACNKYTFKQWIGFVVVGAVALVSYRVTGRNEMLRVVVLLAACKDMETKRLLKTIFWITLTGCLVLVILSLAGIMGTVAITTEFRPNILETRYCFGLGHPNAFHCMVWALITLGGYIYKNQLKLWSCMALFGLNILVFMFTDSRTAVLVAGMEIIGYTVLCLWKKIADYRAYYILCAVVVVACLIGSIVLCEAWEFSTIVRKIDEKLSMRVMVANLDDANAIPSNWTMFGMESSTCYFDMGIIRLFYWYGIIPGTIYMLMNVQLIYNAYKRRDSFLAFAVACCMVYTVIEAHLISDYLLRNYLFILYGLNLTIPIEEKDSKCEYYFWDIRLIRRGIKSEQ